MYDFVKDRNKTRNFIKKYIPYKEILTEYGYPHIVQMKDKSIMSVFKMKFKDDMMNRQINEERSELLAKFLSSFNSYFTFYIDLFHSVNLTEKNYITDKNTPPLAKKIIEKRKEYFYDKRTFFENDIFLCVQYKSKINTFKDNSSGEITTELIERYNNVLEDIKSRAKVFDCELEILSNRQLLGYIYNSCLGYEKYDETFQTSVSLENSIVKEMDAYLGYTPFVLNDMVVQTYSFTDFPITTYPDFFNSFNGLSFPFRVFLKLDLNNSEETKKIITKKKAEHSKGLFGLSALFKKADQQVLTEDDINLENLYGKKGCEEALVKNIETGINISNTTLIITLFAKNEDHLKDEERLLYEVINSKEIKPTKEEELNSFAYFSSFTGAKTDNTFSCYLFNDNVADLIPTNGCDSYTVSNHLKEITKSDEPFLTTLSYTGALRVFSPSGENGNSGHTFITGETGGGKSVLLNLMANEWLKYQNTKVVYLDMGLSCLKTVLQNNGKMFIPTKDKTSFSPLYNAKNRFESVMHFFETISIADKYLLTTEDTLRIKSIIDILPEKSSIDVFYKLYKGKYGNDRLIGIVELYTKTYDRIFTAEEDNFNSDLRVIGIELEPLLTGNPLALTLPSLIYILDRLDEQFKAEEPVLLILDEAWQYLKISYFQNYIQKWLKQLRKKSVFVIIATQELSDMFSSDIKTTVLENTYTKIFLSNKNAKSEITKEYYKQMGLEDFKINTIANLDKFWCCVENKESFIALNFLCEITLDELVVSSCEKENYLREIER